jgi:hypothetical protein
MEGGVAGGALGKLKGSRDQVWSRPRCGCVLGEADLVTRWGATVDPARAAPLPEHPRPQLTRETPWASLNGEEHVHAALCFTMSLTCSRRCMLWPARLAQHTHPQFACVDAVARTRCMSCWMLCAHFFHVAVTCSQPHVHPHPTHCIALHCTALHCTALHCTAPHRTAPYRPPHTGIWEWEPTLENATLPFNRTLNRSILVPFPPESCLSGIRENHPFMQVCGDALHCVPSVPANVVCLPCHRGRG